ncbi:transposase [Bacillus pinisoli]|uniref:transposase n=1 Tax=Bacillus pinisoli TaxID=2901866 RepID=UPI001FF13517|nr:transposase [Bacillus pinisoli]
MARKRRVWHPEMIYHVVSRGNRRDALYLDAKDHKTFLCILNQTHLTCPVQIYSYCMMTNHYHLLIKSPLYSISMVMAMINKRYASYFNNRYRLTGHVFESRFFSEPVISKHGLLEVSRYIHWNPVTAGVVRSPHDYEWSSYRYYGSRKVKPPRFFEPNWILEHFHGSQKEGNEKYRFYCMLADDEQRKEFLAREMVNTR